MKPVMITRHTALVRYAIDRGIVPANVDVLPHVNSPEQIRGRHVVGPIPLHLAAHAAKVTHVPLAIPPELRGQELTYEQLCMYAGPAETYVVIAADRINLDYITQTYGGVVEALRTT